MQRSDQLLNEKARLNDMVRDIADLAIKIDGDAKERQELSAPYFMGMGDAYNSDELLRSVQEDWSGKGSHADFKSDEIIPLEKGRVLGYGMNGEVVEATCKGIRVALKKIRYQRRIRNGQMKEMDVLKKLKHHHIVKLIGTYTQYPYLGLLLWPVARCDLALVLEFIEMAGLFDQSQSKAPQAEADGFLEKLAEHNLTIEVLWEIVGVQDKRIWSSFGCLTRALAYLHENNIRHKDIKPSNILLSRDGIWITDFGSAKDFTADLTSTSESRERGTLRYCAPEVFSYQESGRSADIFSLGCVFLEMVIVLSHKHTLAELAKLRPLKNQSYEGNLDYIDQWLALADPTETKHLLNEIKNMLNHNRTRRPTAKALALRISLADEHNSRQQAKSLYGSCCDIWEETKRYKERAEKLEDGIRMIQG